MLSSKKLKVFSRFVADLATLSKCEERGVAAIALNKKGTQIYSIGINGGPAGGVQCLCKTDTKYGCVHAEAQCIAKNTSTDENKIMICSLSPCVTCATLIINSGFTEVYYIERWKDVAGLELLLKAGVKTYQIGGI